MKVDPYSQETGYIGMQNFSLQEDFLKDDSLLSRAIDAIFV